MTAGTGMREIPLKQPSKVVYDLLLEDAKKSSYKPNIFERLKVRPYVAHKAARSIQKAFKSSKFRKRISKNHYKKAKNIWPKELLDDYS